MRPDRTVLLVLAAATALFAGAARLGVSGIERRPRWIEPWTRMTFVRLAPGTFRMGTPPGEAQREPQETPHTVRLTKSVYLASYEVTEEQWIRVMGSNPSHFQPCPSCPVERVSFVEVERFIDRLNRTATPGFRLPTEAEWEYACRAGGTLPFGARASLGSNDANIDGDYPYGAPQGIARGRTVPVGSFPPNAWGLYDMSGNVWEWTGDWHCPYAGDATDPVGRCDSGLRVIRGGSWKFDGGSARCGLRYTHRPQDSGYSLGLRLAHD
jgi:formylglycine-generating enzyme required for sulfatase activity